MSPRFARFLSLWLLFCGSALLAQELNLKAKEDFLDVVAPIITRGERDIYQSLPDFSARQYFEAIFWYKRNPEPATTGNPFRRLYFERRQVAKLQFQEGNTPGFRTDRGETLLLLGEPADVVQNKLPQSGLRAAFEEIWKYPDHDLELRFVYDGLRPQYVLEDKERHERGFERIRNSQVLDRAEPYISRPAPLTLPNLGFTKDVENLVAEDKFEIGFDASYAFFRGDLNRTELMVGITFRDASDRGMTINLAAYDPYDNKVEDFKQRIQPVNGRMHKFSIVIEPDQYELVLRLEDQDGREAINRQTLDIPHIDPREPSASSLLAASELQTIPLQGFREPKKFVFGERFFAVANTFPVDQDQLFLMQHFYNFESNPEVSFYLDHKPVKANLVQRIEDTESIRMVYAVALNGKDPAKHIIKSIYQAPDGDLVASPLTIAAPKDNLSADLPGKATETDKIRLVFPAQLEAERLDRVTIRPEEGLTIRRMYVYLNGKLRLERSKAPWEVDFEDKDFSISGVNTLVVVADTDQGLLKLERELKPLRVDQNIRTRVVRIYFNAFNENLDFVTDLDFNTLSVEVDGNVIKPREIYKLEEPITYCLLVDSSYSMKDSFEGNVGAVRKFIQSIRPIDQAFVVSFNNQYLKHMNANKSKDVLLAVADSLQVQRPNPKYADRFYIENETFLYDSVISTIHALHQYPGRKVILLVSDGIGEEGIYRRSAMLSYARENDVVIYSLWVDNNPELSDDETAFLQKERTRAEKVARAIGLTRFFAKKDSRHNYISQKIRKASINQGAVKILAEESGGFHYRVFKADRTLIREYVEDIERAIQTQYVMTLDLPFFHGKQPVEIYTTDPEISIRNKSHVKVRKSNPLVD
jgi:GWxTD domain-containing protein